MESEKPLIIFPKPERVETVKRRGFGKNPEVPSHSDQILRLSPKLTALQTAFREQNVSIQDSNIGIEPEKVLVIEIIGSINDFSNAVKRIEGFEWLGQFDINDIEPDHYFYYKENNQKRLSGKLFLIMTNQSAINEMISLWRRYQNDKNSDLGYGYNKFKTLFNLIKDIRYWNSKDRLEETGILENWKESIENQDKEMVYFEIELWYRLNEKKRDSNVSEISRIVSNSGGSIRSKCIIPEIGYHALLANLPIQVISKFLDNYDAELLSCESIMLFRPVGQMASGKQKTDIDLTDYNIDKITTPKGEPIIALLDGLPLSNHSILKQHLIIDDPDNWEVDYPAKTRNHGTGMASLIIHGDLSNRTNPLPRPIYSRPIMKPDLSENEYEEYIPEENELMVDLIHRAVKNIFESEDGFGGTAPTIKIINLSIGDPNRPYIRTISPLARLLDWLSIKYDVLFIVSAGNQNSSIITGISDEEFNSLSAEEIEKLCIKKITENLFDRRILSPAESINCVTVGSLYHDYSETQLKEPHVQIFNELIPSPISSFGNGFNRSIKPDFIFSGGKTLYEKEEVRSSNVELRDIRDRLPGNQPPGNLYATPGLPGDLKKVKYGHGTSNSAALTSHTAGQYYENLIEIFNSNDIENDEYQKFLTPIIKAMLTHGCSWGKSGQYLQDIFKEDGLTSNHRKSLINRWMGYGIPDVDKLINCNDQRATLIGYGELENDEGHLFTLPQLQALSNKFIQNKLTITLAWLSPTTPTSQKYKNYRLWFDVMIGKKLQELMLLIQTK